MSTFQPPAPPPPPGGPAGSLPPPLPPRGSPAPPATSAPPPVGHDRQSPPTTGIGPGAGALLALGGFSLIEGIGVALGGRDPRLVGALALVVAVLLAAVALLGRLLRTAPEARAVAGVLAAVFGAVGVAGLSQGAPGWLQIALAGLVLGGVAWEAARRIPSAVAAAVAALALVATPAAVLGNLTRNAAAAAAVVAALSFALMVAVSHDLPPLRHPQAQRWVLGTAGLSATVVLVVLATVFGGAAIACLVVGGLGVVVAAQQRHSIALGLVAFVLMGTALGQAIRPAATNAASVALLLVVAGVVIIAAGAAAIAVARGTLAVRAGGLRAVAGLPVSIADVLLGVAALLALIAAATTSNNALRPTFGPFGPSSGSGGVQVVPVQPAFSPGPTDGFGNPIPTDGNGSPLPTDANGLVCPSPSTGATPPSGCPSP